MSAGLAPAGAVVDLPSHEALDLMENGHATGVSFRAPVTSIPSAVASVREAQEAAAAESEAAPAAPQSRTAGRGRNRQKSATEPGDAG